MILTAVNVVTCVLGTALGAYTLVRHLNVLNNKPTPVVDAWLVAMGSLAWSVALWSNVEGAIDNAWSLEHYVIGLSGAEAFANVLMLIYWAGALLQARKYCLKFRRKLRRKNQ